jgi:hypothetical protein
MRRTVGKTGRRLDHSVGVHFGEDAADSFFIGGRSSIGRTRTSC